MGALIQKCMSAIATLMSPPQGYYVVLNAPAGKSTITLTVRNIYKEFSPEYNHLFELQNGFFSGTKFNVKNIAPYDDNIQFLKIVGEAAEGGA